MQPPITGRDLADSLTTWYAKYCQEPRGYVCTLPMMRIGLAHKYSYEHLTLNYNNLEDPSPFKKAACICMGIQQALPLTLKGISDPTLAAGTADIKATMDNARMAFGISIGLLSGATFDCKKALRPPHTVTMPSAHFVAEFTEALAGSKTLTVQGVALCLELIFYLSNPDMGLKGCID